MNTKITCLLALIATILLVYVIWDSQGGAGGSSSISDRKAVKIKSTESIEKLVFWTYFKIPCFLFTKIKSIQYQ